MAELFESDGPDWHNRAQLDWQRGKWTGYVLGYKEAADRLVQGINQGQHGQDYLVFPILFLYRHWLEVSIKELILRCQRLSGIERPIKKKGLNKRQDTIARAEGHDLAGLWAYLLQITPRVYAQFDSEIVAGISRAIAGFSRHDPIGDAARYPLTMQGDFTLADLKSINLRGLADDMRLAQEGLYQLEGIFDYEEESRSWVQEASADD
ncbi:hypothetical protein [Pseudoxanthomonas winnipegensis]|jgi:hypothetical protein|uniref:Uncharacterized protein n=1 Tax=Rhodanobacter denitrificans TaxID=666685 RepID=A0A2W5KEU4_9GAMM|nr:hypothetical protein [Pseudoxanthomonas winnipegensis]PZQ13958.1 MAG: hypothetical protein DI564_10315 [Rhodanobacter denitrificans]RZZ90197.1 hypothetical protein EA663_00025 [Pseudoxanthomonas winnipegensis]